MAKKEYVKESTGSSITLLGKRGETKLSRSHPELEAEPETAISSSTLHCSAILYFLSRVGTGERNKTINGHAQTQEVTEQTSVRPPIHLATYNFAEA